MRCDLVAFAGTREHRWEAHDGVSFPTGSRRVMKRTRGALPTQIRQGALGTGSKQARWAREVMTDEDRTWVDEVLGRAVVRMGGMVTEENVGRLLKLTTMADRFQGEQVASPVEVIWAWVAAEQDKGGDRVQAHLARRSYRGKGEVRTMPRWGWYAMVLSGWCRPEGLTHEQTTEMMEADRVLSLLWQAQEGVDWGATDMEAVLTLDQHTARMVWLQVKSSYKGAGGYSRYLQLLALLLLSGEMEGGVGHSPEESWWEQGKERAKWLGMGEEKVLPDDTKGVEQQLGATGPSKQVDVVVDWMSGTQSLRAAVPRGVVYLPFDLQADVYSVNGRWVKNIAVDLLLVTGAHLWDMVQTQIRKRFGARVKVGKVLLAMSPCCRTFSKADSTNISRDNHYRLSGPDHPSRPPRDATTAKGRSAHKADRMVKRGIEVATYFATVLSAKFYMENPVGGLCKRPYMSSWVRRREGGVRLLEVHYCAYRHPYHKPTHFWTNLTVDQWQPKGTTGSGRCEGRCEGGRMSQAGRWEHEFKIAQGSWQAMGGKGRKAYKIMIPKALHLEILRAVGIVKIRVGFGTRSGD